ncbi:isochorismatase family protein [Williamwhitmania taraxaci]|uniref:Nicotinamidase-related amidase n=1 Tax=Williamwhitmania taraxaci TaxID=1640674 RepID=A0A1G6MT52_9BACT|nr:isochorismatase family protein [Williamwhitmania taraxaci]SDC58692.1 Nicotinamidase-related amidase [Williamwhitmania taraxaci]
MKTALFIIDMQNDFCKPTGSLYIPGAEHDVARLSTFIDTNSGLLNAIILTQDNHQVMDIAHPGFWRNGKGEFPAPFTGITYADIVSGVWIPRFEKELVLQYLNALDVQGEFPHTIWPEHCLMGSEGAAIVPEIMNAVNQWASQGRFYQLVVKGTNPFTEHFGALRSNVPIDGAPETQLNVELVMKLKTFDRILVAGEAKSHCVANTIKQLFAYPDLMKRLVILNDCMSNVPGFEQIADPIYQRALAMGAVITNSTNINL